jgi:hypothetical protein
MLPRVLAPALVRRPVAVLPRHRQTLARSRQHKKTCWGTHVPEDRRRASTQLRREESIDIDKDVQPCRCRRPTLFWSCGTRFGSIVPWNDHSPTLHAELKTGIWYGQAITLRKHCLFGPRKLSGVPVPWSCDIGNIHPTAANHLSSMCQPGGHYKLGEEESSIHQYVLRDSHRIMLAYPSCMHE